MGIKIPVNEQRDTECASAQKGLREQKFARKSWFEDGLDTCIIGLTIGRLVQGVRWLLCLRDSNIRSFSLYLNLRASLPLLEHSSVTLRQSEDHPLLRHLEDVLFVRSSFHTNSPSRQRTFIPSIPLTQSRPLNNSMTGSH